MSVAQPLRLFIHCLGLLFIPVYLLTSRQTMLLILGGIVAFLILFEIIRFSFKPVNTRLFDLLGSVFRHQEKTHLLRATYFFTGIVLSVFFFRMDVALLCILFTSLGDSAASLIGQTYGQKEKSVYGSTAFFLLSIMFGSLFVLFFDITWLQLVLGAFAGALAEFWLPLDDDLTVPLVSGFVMSLL